MQAFVTATATVLALSLVSPAASQQPIPDKAAQAEVVPNKAVPDKPTTPSSRAVRVNAATAAKKAPFVFEAGETELLELVERCGAYLQFNILVDSSGLQSTGRGRGGGGGRVRGRAPAQKAPAEDTGPIVSLQLPVVTDHNGCEDLLSSMLWSHGLSLVALDEQKSVYEVLSRTGQRAREIVASSVSRTPEQVLAQPMLRSYVSTLVMLKHINAQLANNALRPFFSASGSNIDSVQIGNIGNKMSLLLTGPQFMVASAVKLISRSDVPGQEVSPRIENRFKLVVKANEALRRRIEELERRLPPRK